MFIFGINFNLFFLCLIGRFTISIKSQEFWAYLGIVLASTVVIALNIRHMYSSFWESLRHAVFQVSSYISTTGFNTANANAWPSLSKAILLILMFIGACAGSTAGGLKVARFVILIKAVHKRIRQVIYPRTVKAVKFEGKSLDEEQITAVLSYFAIYSLCIAALFIAVSFEPFSMETNFSAAVSAFNNVGPLFGEVSTFAPYSVSSKLLLSFAMLLGRLEIYPLIILFMPVTWKK